MPAINEQAVVSKLVREAPRRSRVFEQFGIGYCCGANRSIAEVCEEAGVETESLLAELNRLESETPEGAPVEELAPNDLIEHILLTHHAYLQKELPRLERMAERVASVHGNKDPRLEQVSQAVQDLHEELRHHMGKEEHVLFPAIQNLVTGGDPAPVPLGRLSEPISAMNQDHERAHQAIRVLSEYTDDFTPPDWACNTYRAMLDGMRELMADLDAHTHKEDNLLFPQALAAEAELQARS